MACFSACVADSGSQTGGNPSDRHEWQAVSGDMSMDEYRDAYRHNQRIVSDSVKSYSESALTSIGIPKSGVKFISAATGLAVGQDANFYLDERKIMALELKDTAHDERAVLFRIKIDW